MRVRRAALMIAGTTVMALWPARVLASGPGWLIAATPDPSGGLGSSLQAISCTSTTSCVAVEYYVASPGGSDLATLAERWNGYRWTLLPTVNPSNESQTELNGVACSSSSSCIAVGYYQVKGTNNILTLAEIWNGTTWTIQPTTNPGASQSKLEAVSCSSATACTAVGFYDDTNNDVLTLAQRWNGSGWTVQPMPSPSTTPGWELHGVSCATATSCTAVGRVINTMSTFADGAVAEGWNGSTWRVWPTAQPSGAKESILRGVSCTSATACTAVGTYDFGNDPRFALAEGLDGRSATVWATTTRDTQFDAVSCPAVTSCTAAGFSLGGVLAQRWNGGSWAVQPTSDPSGGAGDDLGGVSCTSTTWCMAVGAYGQVGHASATLAEGGSSWVTTQTSDLDGASDQRLNGVACTSASACTAVGDYTTSAGVVSTLAERWNGTAWTIKLPASPSGAQGSELNGVSCPSASACIAVGTYADSTGKILSLAERWNGTSWSLLHTVNPSGGTHIVLQAVSCAAATACSAVGSYKNGSGILVTLAEVWNGSTWSVQTTNPPSGAQQSIFLGVSCTATSACTAVGDYTSSSGALLTLAERWNGNTWALQSTPNPGGGTLSLLNSVSCTSATACMAVGASGTSPSVTLTEIWSGSAWAIKASPTVSGAQGSVLQGVSCTSASACNAVGDYNKTGTQTLIEHWNGQKWTVQPAPTPTDAQSSFLSAVTCASATQCMSAGHYADGSGAGFTLAEM